VQRALIKPSGAISHNAAPGIWRSFDGAAEIAKQLGFNAQDGGLAFVMPPLSDTAPPAAVFFSLPPFTITLGPVAAALGADVPMPLGPFAADALEKSGWQPGGITPAAPALPTEWQPAEITATAQAPEPGWQGAEITISLSTPASWRDVLAQLDGTLAYLQEFKTWCRLRVAERRP
jgi:hypothetical protein